MGGGKIKDATALPSDVAKGKIFYNNEGKQEGTGTVLKMLKISVPNGTVGSARTPNSSVQYFGYDTSLKLTVRNGSGNSLDYHCIKQAIQGKICFCELETPSGNLIYGSHLNCKNVIYITDSYIDYGFGFGYDTEENTIYYMNKIEKPFPVTINVFYK